MKKRDLFEWHIDRGYRDDYDHFGKGEIMEAFNLVEAQYNDKSLVKKLNLQNVTNSEKGKLIAVDNDLYLVAEHDHYALMRAIGSACGVNCPETRQDVRKECMNIKNKYKPIACEFHETPGDQFKGTPASVIDKNNLPF
jgi:hypothetical protein